MELDQFEQSSANKRIKKAHQGRKGTCLRGPVSEQTEYKARDEHKMITNIWKREESVQSLRNR